MSSRGAEILGIYFGCPIGLYRNVPIALEVMHTNVHLVMITICTCNEFNVSADSSNPSEKCILGILHTVKHVMYLNIWPSYSVENPLSPSDRM